MRDTGASTRDLLCWACMAAPLSNICGLAVALYSSQTLWPMLTISDVIKSSPGLNVVACGWTIFAAAYSSLCTLQHLQLSDAALSINNRSTRQTLLKWLRIRSYITTAVVLLMSVIHLVPIGVAPDAVHLTVAGLFAFAGSSESINTVWHLEPILIGQNLLPEFTHSGSWLRRVCLYVCTPGWIVVVCLMGMALAIGSTELQAVGGILEFTIISLYGCYPLSFLSAVDTVHKKHDLGEPRASTAGTEAGVARILQAIIPPGSLQ